MIIISDCEADQCELTESNHDITMVTVSNCEHCIDMKNVLSKQIDSGKIKVIDEENPNFAKILESKGIDGVPSFLVDDKVCDFTGTETNPKLDCNGKEVEL